MDATGTPEAAPAPTTLAEQVRKVLAEAPKPLTAKQVKAAVDKLYPPGAKKAAKPSPAGIQGELEKDGVFAHPPTTKGEPTYWHRKPQTAAEGVAEAVRAKVEELDEEAVVPESKLGKPTKAKATPETTKAFEDALDELLRAGKLYRHGAYFGRRKPATAAERMAAVIRAKVNELGDEPVKPSKSNLGKPAATDREGSEAFAAELKRLAAEGVLHEHPGGKYGKRPPPKPTWYEADPARKAFASLVAAAQKVLALNAAPADEVLALLRQRLRLSAALPAEPTKPTASPPAVVTPPPVPPPAADLRAVLKQAYDHLCQFVEFRDKLVELPRLYREAAKRTPGLGVDDFHRELWQLSEERRVQLHVLNEVREAKEPQLAIRRNDSLYYFVRWN